MTQNVDDQQTSKHSETSVLFNTFVSFYLHLSIQSPRFISDYRLLSKPK